MGWSIGFDANWNRDIGYGVVAWCDHPECVEKIDRGLGFVCGGAPYGGDDGCGLYFCGAHGGGCLCERCNVECDEDGCETDDCREHLPPVTPFDAKPEHPEWIAHKLNDPSWQAWRLENADEVFKLAAQAIEPEGRA